jgi:hypothetical protein
MVASSGALILGRSSLIDLHWQIKAWRFYGTPDGTASFGIRTNQGAIGEVRFVMGWVAQQIGRIEWHVEIDGDRLDDKAAEELMRQVSNEESTIAIATNMIVAGELNYIAMSDAEIERLNDSPRLAVLSGPVLPGDSDRRWMAVSVVDNFRQQLLEAANKDGLNLRAIWPHPGKLTAADPPLRSVIDVLEEIEQLQDVSYSQNRSRIAQMGILTVAQEFDMAVPGGDFGTRLEEAINAPIADPRRTAAGPILLRGPFELMTGERSNGSRGVQWTMPDHDFDTRLDDKMRFLIQRLAWGFPVAPEILLGMTATNRAVAFQIEESTYRSHVEPIAKLVGRVYAKALAMIIEDETKRVEVLPDATELLARRHSVADAKDAYDRGLVRAKWVRRVLGIDEEDAAEQADLDRILLLKGGSGGGNGPAREPDPSEVSGGEPVKASASAPLLDAGDLSASLRGAADMALASAISRIGAAARTRISRQPLTPGLDLDPDAITNQRLPSMLGVDRLDELSLDLVAAVDPASDWLVAWWESQIDGTYPAAAVEDSVIALRRAFGEWCANGACAWPLPRTGMYFPDPILSPLVVSVLESATEPGGD